MSKNTSQEVPKSLLPYEHAFVIGALAVARANHGEAQLSYGEAVANSGGDWVFDDPASQAALQEAGLKGATVALLRTFSRLEVAKFPGEDTKEVAPGSRVFLEMFGDVDVYDVVSRKIPNFPQDPSVFALISAESPLGKAILGATTGDTIEWQNDDGHRNFTGVVAGVDQVAQRNFYESVGHHLS